MADYNENNEVVVANENTAVATQQDQEKLTTGEKVILAGAVGGIGFAGYLIGTFIVAPIVRNARDTMALKREIREEYRRQSRSNGQQRRSRVDYDEDGDYREPDDDQAGEEQEPPRNNKNKK